MKIRTDGPTLHLHGDFDARSTASARTALYDRLESHDHVIVDLSEVPCVDITALKVLAAASRLAWSRDQLVTLRGCNGAVRRLLHLTHLIRLVDLERGGVPA